MYGQPAGAAVCKLVWHWNLLDSSLTALTRLSSTKCNALLPLTLCYCEPVDTESAAVHVWCAVRY